VGFSKGGRELDPQPIHAAQSGAAIINSMFRRWYILTILCYLTGDALAQLTPNFSAEGELSSQSAAADAETLNKYSYTQVHMAMPVRLTVWCGSQRQARTACQAAFRRITELELALTDYDSRSELRQLCKVAGHEPVNVSDELFDVLQHARRMTVSTGGAFDATAGEVIQLWRTARKTGRLPEAAGIEESLRNVGATAIELDSHARTVAWSRPRLWLDLGGIAKGFIGDHAMVVLRDHGIGRARYHAGGDMVLGDAPPGKDGWEIDLPGLPETVLANCGVSVSGDTSQFLEVDGIRYSHVIDPRTGQAVTSRQMAVVVAPSGVQSDALASAGCVMEKKAFDRLMASLPHTSGRTFIAEDHDE